MCKKILAAGLLSLGLVTSANAGSVGFQVNDILGTPFSGTVVDTGACTLGPDCIGFLIPLNGDTKSLFLGFDSVSTTSASVLNLTFQDLDLAGVNDPSRLLEQVSVFNGGGDLLGAFTDVNDPGVSGDNDIQSISIALGVLPANSFFAQLDFSVQSRLKGGNTAEFLVAEIQAVPVPAALPFLMAGLGALGLMGWRRNRSAA
ncbi:VPLPA-CTERM sorting domain-containing protein [uncultured Roseibium sp.]|uniref:VPLPA-CTERM sorting domain-containing protein n=1 Tax=uncultured Roseibium sp. TaxID=1936171 RepID=UPI00263519EF|nr:VPLPA-CTERM sorting domain-containing protein [uncultured Roseibium sp.]